MASYTPADYAKWGLTQSRNMLANEEGATPDDSDFYPQIIAMLQSRGIDPKGAFGDFGAHDVTPGWQVPGGDPNTMYYPVGDDLSKAYGDFLPPEIMAAVKSQMVNGMLPAKTVSALVQYMPKNETSGLDKFMQSLTLGVIGGGIGGAFGFGPFAGGGGGVDGFDFLGTNEAGGGLSGMDLAGGAGGTMTDASSLGGGTDAMDFLGTNEGAGGIAGADAAGGGGNSILNALKSLFTSGGGGADGGDISWGKILSSLAPIAGSIYASGAAKDAANTQANSANQANQFLQQIYGDTTKNLAPWLQGGQTSLKELMNGLGLGTATNDKFGSLMKPFGMEDFKESPSYQFNLQRGQDAINKASAARGTYYAPATLQKLGEYTQGVAGNDFNNAYNMYNQNQANQFNRLANVSGAGQNAAVQQGGFGAGLGNAVAGNITGAGNALAAGQVGSANAISGGLGNAYNNYLMQQILGKNQTPTYTGGTSNSSSQDEPDFWLS